MLKFNTEHQTITRIDSFSPVADSKNYLTASFIMSEEWSGDIIAIFGHNGSYYHQKLEGGRCLVPWEVIRAPYFTVSLFCGDLVTANTVQVAVAPSGLIDGEVPGTPTPTVFQQMLGEIRAEVAHDTSAARQEMKEYTDGRISAEADGRTAADSELRSLIETETAERQSAIEAETAERRAELSALETFFLTVIGTYAAADLVKNITCELSFRLIYPTSADTFVLTADGTEIARCAADGKMRIAKELLNSDKTRIEIYDGENKLFTAKIKNTFGGAGMLFAEN